MHLICVEMIYNEEELCQKGAEQERVGSILSRSPKFTDYKVYSLQAPDVYSATELFARSKYRVAHSMYLPTEIEMVHAE